MVEELISYTPQDLADLDALMHELSATSFCYEELLNKALNDANVHVYVIRDEGDNCKKMRKTVVKRLKRAGVDVRVLDNYTPDSELNAELKRMW